MASLHLVELVILATACMLVQGESIPSVVQNNGQHLGKEEDAGDPSLNGLPEDDQAKMKQNNPVQSFASVNGQCKPKDCADLYSMGQMSSGVYSIYPRPQYGVRVYCDMLTDGGGWTVFQKRVNGDVDFYKGWEEYAEGFGDSAQDYWLGLRHVHALTKRDLHTLYVKVTDYNGQSKYATYGSFSVSSEAKKFRLSVNDFSGDAGDSMVYSNGQKFSTKDQDHDGSGGHCSISNHGAWWYQSCAFSNLNGQFSATKVSGGYYMYWYYFNNSWQSMQTTVMMMRPTNFNP